MSKLLIRLGAFAALMGLASGASAQTCVTRTEAQNLVQFVLPDTITGIRDKCASTLSPGAFLTRSGGTLAERYKPGAAQAWPKAKPVALRVAGDAATLLSAVPDSALKTLAGNFVSAAVARELPVEKCGTVDRVMEAVAPLPPANMAMLIVTLMELQSKPTQVAAPSKTGGLTICSIAPTPAAISTGSK